MSREPGARAAQSFDAPEPSAEAYGTRATQGGSAGGERAEALAKALLGVAKERGMTLEGDGRLASLAGWIGAHTDERLAPPPSPVVDFGARHLGLTEPVPLLLLLGQGHEDSWPASLAELLAGGPQSVPYNRYGVAVVSRFGERLAVVALSAVLADVEPVPRHAVVGAALPVRASLHDGYRHAQLAVTLPDGSVQRVADTPGDRLDVALPLSTRGVHRVELLGDGPHGIEVLANFPIFVGVDEPRVMAVEAEGPLDASQAAAKLLALLNASRAAARLAPVTTYEPLAAIAASHSRDMIAHGFFGHVSPTTGDPAARVKSAGFAFPLVAENIGRASSPEVVHQLLMESPAHRANLLNPALTHVGIGVVPDAHGEVTELVATELFARMAKPIDVAAAPGDVAQAINVSRAAHGARALPVDPHLAAAAQKGAAAFFEGTRTREEALDVANRALGPVGGRSQGAVWRSIGRIETYVTTIAAVEDAGAFEFVNDPTVSALGVGVMQGARAESGPSTIAVVVILGWARGGR